MFIVLAMQRPQVKGIVIVTTLLALRPCDGSFASASMQDTARYQLRENGWLGRKTFRFVPHLDYRPVEPAAARVGPWGNESEHCMMLVPVPLRRIRQAQHWGQHKEGRIFCRPSLGERKTHQMKSLHASFT